MVTGPQKKRKQTSSWQRCSSSIILKHSLCKCGARDGCIAHTSPVNESCCSSLLSNRLSNQAHANRGDLGHNARVTLAGDSCTATKNSDSSYSCEMRRGRERKGWCMRTYVYVCMLVCACVCARARVHVSTRAYACVCMCVHARAGIGEGEILALIKESSWHTSQTSNKALQVFTGSDRSNHL